MEERTMECLRDAVGRPDLVPFGANGVVNFLALLGQKTMQIAAIEPHFAATADPGLAPESSVVQALAQGVWRLSQAAKKDPTQLVRAAEATASGDLFERQIGIDHQGP